MSTPPAICTELKIQPGNGVPVVNSRDVAEMFEKRHSHVLRDIDVILTNPNLGALNWLQPVSYSDTKGETRRSFDMTRDGFTVLVMGWTGQRAMQFKVRYIEAFNAMEAALKEPAEAPNSVLLAAIREIVAPLAVRFNSQEHTIDNIDNRLCGVDNRLNTVDNRLGVIERAVRAKRKIPTLGTKQEIVEDTERLGGRCPCCAQSSVVENGERSAFSEFDHFYASSNAQADSVWLICKPCHHALTHGRVARDQREPEFRAFQQQRRRLPGRQIALF